MTSGIGFWNWILESDSGIGFWNWIMEFCIGIRILNWNTEVEFGIWKLVVNKTGLTTFYNPCATCIVLMPKKLHRSWYAPCACFLNSQI